jgi:iron-sulfur cluster assembly protein
MLTLTDQAAEAIRSMIDDADAGPNAGLRISGSTEGDGETALELEVAEGPSDGDETLESGGVHVYLDETAAAVLSDKQLDVHAHGDHFHFSIDEQS